MRKQESKWTSQIHKEHAVRYTIYTILQAVYPAKVNQIVTRLPGHCDGPACSQPASSPARCQCYRPWPWPTLAATSPQPTVGLHIFL